MRFPNRSEHQLDFTPNRPACEAVPLMVGYPETISQKVSGKCGDCSRVRGFFPIHNPTHKNVRLILAAPAVF